MTAPFVRNRFKGHEECRTHVQVGDNVLRLGASRDLVDLLNSLLQLLLLPRSNVDLGAVLRKAQRHHLANAGAAAGNKHDLAVDAKEGLEGEIWQTLDVGLLETDGVHTLRHAGSIERVIL